MLKYFLIMALFLQIACFSAAQQVKIEQNSVSDQPMKAERKPFRKSSAVIKTPDSYLKRETNYGVYDPKPKVILIDEKSGKYELRWIGYDGKEKIVQYQRADAIEAIVEAKTEKNSEGKFVYKYLVKNLPASPTYLSSFTVQTLAGDTEVIKMDNVFIGDMIKSLQDFNEGTWWHYGILGETGPKLAPGKSIEFSLISSALPGIVGCRATAGDLTLKGAGEHMPSELEKAMPGYEEWAAGYTIGPVERLTSLTKSERANYLLENLSKFREAGWMTVDAVKNYESILKTEDLAGAFAQAQTDLKSGIITGEVFHIIEGLSR